jgi:hypothetical protein
VRVRSRPVLLALALVAVVSLHVPATARADGDPASDTLIFHQVYTPVTQTISPSVLKELQATILASNAAGVKVRVALILGKTDLGAVPQLFGHPVEYAHLLAGELYFAWKGGIVAVQPSGIGVRNFTPLAPAQKIAGRIKVATPVTADSLANAADAAIRALAASKGKTLPGGPGTGGSKSSFLSFSNRWLVGGVALALIVLVVIGTAALRLRRSVTRARR